MEEMSTPGIGVMAHGVDQMLADKRSATSYQREKSLMNKQNAMNLSNAMTMPSIQAHGLRMAGFNPAMVNGAGTQPAPTVTKGSADMAQTFPLDVGGISQLALLDAQRENIQAQTELTKAQANTEANRPDNIKADTNYKLAQTLYTGAGTDKLKTETENLRNINEQYKDQNKALGEMGQVLAQKWQSQPWYKSLGEETRNTIDAMAAGELPMTVGGMKAIFDVIGAQRDLSNADREQAQNAVLSEVALGQLSDDNVMKALEQDPVVKQNLTKAQTGKILTEAEKLRYKMKELIDLELQGKKYSNQKEKEEAIMAAAKKIAFKAGDMDYTRATGDYGNYAWLAFEKLANKAIDILSMILAGKLGGKFIGKSVAEELKDTKPVIDKPGDRGFNETLRDINRRGPFPSPSGGNSTGYIDFGKGR